MPSGIVCKIMRTLRARSLRRRSLLRARLYGHKPALVSHHGALALYACYGCNSLMEVWDSPDCVNGSMPQVPCKKDVAVLALWRKAFLKMTPM